MCNLLVPLCPFVLHAITHPNPQDPPPNNPSTDAKIFYSYLSRRPYQSSSRKDACQTPAQPRTLSLPSTKLYKRTTWHTCACFFAHVSVMHPLPGPSRPTFGSPSQYCRRCSSASKVLRPFRRGGPSDLSTRNDPFWNRCSFLGASGVFEAGGGNDDDDDDDQNENISRATAPARPVTVTVKRPERTAGTGYRSDLRVRDDWEYRDDATGQWDGDDGSDFQHRGPSSREGVHGNRNSDSSRARHLYQDDLDSYLKETYGERRKRGRGIWLLDAPAREEQKGRILL